MGDNPNPQECSWEYMQDGHFETMCGEPFVLLNGTPSENNMKFCPFCGKPIKEDLKT